MWNQLQFYELAVKYILLTVHVLAFFVVDNMYAYKLHDSSTRASPAPYEVQILSTRRDSKKLSVAILENVDIPQSES